MVKTQSSHRHTQIILRPNRSANWREIKWFLLFMAVILSIVSLGWLFVGVWIVLPFAGLELALLSYLMFSVNRATCQQQVLTIKPERISLQSGIEYPQEHREFDRHDCYLQVAEPDTEFDKVKLCLKDPSGMVEIGWFLNAGDAEKAHKLLKKAGLPVCSNQWWKSL